MILYIKTLKNQRSLSEEHNTTSCCLATAFNITGIVHIVPTLSHQTCLYALIPRDISGHLEKCFCRKAEKQRIFGACAEATLS